MCYLIVNADDFGLSAGVNAGIAAAYRHGIVTSASLMVRQAGAENAARLSRELPALSVGLHLDLGEWACYDGDWRAVYEVVALDDPDAIRTETQRQLDRFRQLMGREPTHIDSHQHVHQHDPIRELIREIAAELEVPLRHFSSEVRYCGDFYGQTGDGAAIPEAISTDRLSKLIAELPPGITELACHPGFDEQLPTMYRQERGREVVALCAPRVLEAARRHVKLISFAQLPHAELSS